MKKRVLLQSLLLITLSFNLFAQNQNTAFMRNWHFGWFSGVSFASGSPVALAGSTMISEEGCVSHSDNQGNLLFYSDGGKQVTGFTAPGGVRNANHQLMPNGNMSNGEGGCDSSPQSALVIQKNANEYYLFTIGCMNGVGLKKSIIDMSLDSGLGDVTIKGEIVAGLSGSSLAEGMTATKHANGVDHWLIVHNGFNNEFYVFLVTSSSVSAPVTYAVGSSPDNYGQIKVSVQGDKIAFNTEVFDFNSSTGVISNPNLLGSESFWGRAFSASGNFLYMRTIMGEMYQYDMNASDIGASKTLISANITAAGNLQLGPDLKIYGASNSAQYLSAIKFPELPGVACDYVVNQVLLPGNNSCQMGLPNFIDSELKSVLSTENLAKENLLHGFYPNPAENNLYFKSEINFDDITIRTADGKLVSDWTSESQSLIIENLPQGVYLLYYRGSNVKFIKQ